MDKFGISGDSAIEAADLFRSRMEIVAPAKFAVHVCRDRDDDQILGTAVACKCGYIITGDKDLLILGAYGETKIVTPRQFADQEA